MGNSFDAWLFHPQLGELLDMARALPDATIGPDRCMSESNYPVDRESLPCTVLWNALQKIATRYNDDEQDAMFSGTARRVYRLAR